MSCIDDTFNILCHELRENDEKRSIGRSWCNFPSRASGILYNMDFARGDRVRTELYIIDNKPVFNALLVQREAVERELGEELDWQSLPDRRASRITLYCAGSIENSEEQLAQIRSWVIDRLLKLKRVFGPRLDLLSRRRRAY